MPLSINQIPIPVPSSTDPANFSARGDAVFGAFPNFITQTNAVASEAAANRDSAEASKVAAAISETNAATYAANATTSANNASSSSTAPLWVSGTTYAINDKRVSPITGQVYRRKTAGAGTTDPSLDSTNWYAVLLDADTQYPSIKPTLNLDFANSGKLDPRITFTRASTATYYDGKTFAKAEENLLSYSQDFDNAVWGKTSVTITANTTTAPDGTTTAASLVTANGSSGLWYLQQLTAVAAPALFSIYAKANTANHLGVVLGNAGVFAGVDLSTGTVTLQGSGYVVTAASIGGGWYRITVAVAGGGDRARIFASTTPITVANQPVTGDGTSGIYIWGAQLEQRSSATAYTPTTSQPITKYQPVLKTASNNEPRFDYDPVTLEAKGLLIEEQRTNLLLWSQQLDAVEWTRAYMSVLTNSAMAPDGSMSADLLIGGTSSDAKSTYQTLTVSSGISYTFSVYAKAAGVNYVILRYQAVNFPSVAIRFSLTDGTTSPISGYTAPASSDAKHVGGGWYRLSITSTATGSGPCYPTVALSKDTTSYAYTGDGFSGIYIWGAQLEVGSFPTSYIPTTATAVTRQADNAVMTGTNFSSWYNQSEGSIYADWEPTGEAPYSNVLCISDGSPSNAITIYRANSSQQMGFAVTTSAVLEANIIQNTPQYLYTNQKIAGAYKLNDFAATFNSQNVSSDMSGTLPSALNKLSIGGGASGAVAVENYNGHIKKIAYYPRRIPNYQLQILTK